MIKIIKGDIAKVEADVIVNATNTTLKHGGGVAAVIVRVGGNVIQEESDKIGFVPIGGVGVTSAGNLKAKKVFHISTIDWESGKKATLEDIKMGTKAALDKAEELKFKTIAFPLLGAGVVGLSEDKVLSAIIRVAIDYVYIDVILCIKQ